MPPSPLRRLKRGIARFKRWLHGPRVDEPLAYERYGSNTASGAGTVMELFRNRLGSILLAASVSTGVLSKELALGGAVKAPVRGTLIDRSGAAV